MVFSLAYIVLAILGLSFLIFIHELGHFWVARRAGMKVETFSIGFGKPIYSWNWDGVKWQIGWIPAGGYVKIAGQELDKDTDPYQVPGGFFSKTPLERIKVALAGPIANLLFALLAFGMLWAMGGRDKSYSEFTKKIGWIDPQSELYAQGIRPGDEIHAYNGNAFHEAKDHLYAPLFGGDEIRISGERINYQTGEKTPFELQVKPYAHPVAKVAGRRASGLKTTGVLNSANYVIYNRLSDGSDNPLPEGSPMLTSGLRYGDRVVWVDGQQIFSMAQLNRILNDGKALLTIRRNGKTFLRRAPRVEAQELKLDHGFKEELADWQFEAQLNTVKFPHIITIPYNLTNDGVVEGDVKYIDKENQVEAFPQHLFSQVDEPLQPGDKIIAVDGFPISRSYELLSRLQNHYVNIIVERNSSEIAQVSSKEADSDFDKELEMKDLQKISATLGTENAIRDAGDFHLLNPILPKTRSEFVLTPDKQALLVTEILAQKKEIEAIENPETRTQAMQQFEKKERELMLGIPQVQDRHVIYNPNPLEQFVAVYDEIVGMLKALVTGHAKPQYLGGPVGMIHAVHENSKGNLKEMLFWMGAISLNLGILNLLPIPVLDGGTILITLVEMISGRRVHPKILEMIVIPFAVMLILFFIYLTYNDLSRIFGIFT